ncbi:MAG: V4R domain-containing protein [Candidatus Lokiarchaeia archaeon]
MKVRNTGIEFMDQSLGAFYNGLPIMFSTDLTTTDDAVKLGNLIALKILEEGGGCILVYENLPFSLAINGTLYFHSPEKRRILQEAMNEGRLYYLNIVLEDTIITPPFNRSEFITPIVNDLNRIMYGISNAKNQIKESFSDIPVLILQTNISSLIVDFESKAVLNMIKNLILNVKRGGDFFLGILNREMQEENVTNSFTHFADYILEFGIDNLEGKKQSYVSLIRTPLVKDTKKRLYKKFAYELSEDKFYTIPSLHTSFEELIGSISYLERGEVIAYDTNYVFTELHNFVYLLKEVEKKLGRSEYIKIINNVGKSIGSHIAKALSSRFKLPAEELFQAAVNHLSITGWGKFNIFEYDTKSQRISVEGFSKFAASYGKSDYSVCALEGSILQGVLEEITPLNWVYNEKECIAKGDKKCKFELELRIENDHTFQK